MSRCLSCKESFDQKEHFPMEIKPCRHYICQKCSDRSEKCPTCSKGIGSVAKSYKKMEEVAQQRSQLVDIIHKDRRAKQVVIFCQNHDQTVWSQRKQKCIKCQLTLPGWKCQKCKYYLCDICSETIYSYEACPNGHPMQWNGKWKTPYDCQKCHKTKVSLPCGKCAIRHCVNCRNEYKQRCSKHNSMVKETTNKYCKSFACYKTTCTECVECGDGPRCYIHQSSSKSNLSGSCPTEQAYRQKQQCSRPYCNNSAFWKCKTCAFKVCNFCASSEFQIEICPNGHKNKWCGQRTNKCSHCLKTEPGWMCQKCQYNLCRNCEKYNPIKYFPGAYQHKAKCSLI